MAEIHTQQTNTTSQVRPSTDSEVLGPNFMWSAGFPKHPTSLGRAKHEDQNNIALDGDGRILLL